MRRFLLALGLLAVPASAQAVPLLPGLSVVPNEQSIGSGSLLASGTQTGVAPGAYTATLHYAVYKNAGGTLDFLFQVENASSSIDSLRRLDTKDYTGFSTDVFYAAQDAALASTSAFVAGTQAPTMADRNAAGSRVGFDFGTTNSDPNRLNPGEISRVLVIRTNATGYKNSTANTTTHNGVDFNFNTFAPTPEPTSLVLLGGCAGLMGLRLGARRLRKGVDAAEPTAAV